MNLIRQGENQLLDSNSQPGGQLRHWRKRYDLPLLSAPFLSEFAKRYPNIHIKVTNRTSIECAASDNGQVDFYSTNYPNPGLVERRISMLARINDIFVATRLYFQ